MEFIGLGILVLLWYLLTMGESPMVPSIALPSPGKVIKSYVGLFTDPNLNAVQSIFRSIGLNLSGYVKAILFSIPIGFLIGLSPIFKGMYQRPLDAVRFIPLAAVTTIFIIWFGSGIRMKANFLAFGIFIFLTPIVVQRINEVKDVYLKTVYTIGANNWQTIKSVYIPSVCSRLIDDIRVLTAISWTYIIFIENIAKDGGIGALLFSARRTARTDMLFALLILIIIIGVIQDRIFVGLDKELFPHKFQIKNQYEKAGAAPSLWDSTMKFAGSTLIWILLGSYVILAVNEYVGFIDIKFIDYLFGDTCWVFHLIMLSIIGYKGYGFYNRNRNKFVSPTISTDASDQV